MLYVIIFLAGAAAAVSPLFIWYYAYIAQLRNERRLLKEEHQRFQTDSSKLAQRYNDLQTKQAQLDAANEG